MIGNIRVDEIYCSAVEIINMLEPQNYYNSCGLDYYNDTELLKDYGCILNVVRDGDTISINVVQNNVILNSISRVELSRNAIFNAIISVLQNCNGV